MLSNNCGVMNMPQIQSLLTNDANYRCEAVARNILKAFYFS